MKLRTSRWPSFVLLVCGALGASALISGCCSTYDDDTCALFDSSLSCPSREEFSDMIGGEDVTEGPQERSFIDMRPSKDITAEPAYGSLCCYRVKRHSCPQMCNVY